MAISAQFTVTAAAQPLIMAPPGPQPGPVGWWYITNGAAVIYLGGPGVTVSSGAAVAASATLSGFLWPGDVIWAVSAGSSTVGVLRTGS